jgi:hypothetical protein
MLLGDPTAIAEQELPPPAGTKTGRALNVHVGETVGPGHFYVQLRGTETGDALDLLMKQMTEDYTTENASDATLRVPPSVAPVGNFFATEFNTLGENSAFSPVFYGRFLSRFPVFFKAGNSGENSHFLFFFIFYNAALMLAFFTAGNSGRFIY